VIRPWLASHKTVLQILWGVSVALWLALLMAVRSGMFPASMSTVLSVPALICFGVVHMLLLYESWFRKKRGKVLGLAERAFVALLVGAYVLAVMLYTWFFLV
jgi:hypothetical protein